MPRATAAALARSGWDVVHAGEAGLARADDASLLARAKAERRAIVTLDATFHAALATGGAKGPSVIHVRRDAMDGAALAALIDAVYAQIAIDLAAGAIAIVTPRALRLLRLPITRPAPD